MFEAARRKPAAFHIVVAGAGAAGAELAACCAARLRAAGAMARVTLVEAGPRLLPERSPQFAARVERALARRTVRTSTGRAIAAAAAGRVTLDDGSALDCDALIWATGAAPPPLLARSGLALDARGFLRTRATLQLVGHDELFAAGDCAALEDYPQTARAGVISLREGQVLTRNLRAAHAGRPLERFRPQADFLTLLNLGDGTAIGAKRGFAFEGRWVMRWKDWIDRRYLRRFATIG